MTENTSRGIVGSKEAIAGNGRTLFEAGENASRPVDQCLHLWGAWSNPDLKRPLGEMEEYGPYKERHNVMSGVEDIQKLKSANGDGRLDEGIGGRKCGLQADRRALGLTCFRYA